MFLYKQQFDTGYEICCTFTIWFCKCHNIPCSVMVFAAFLYIHTYLDFIICQLVSIFIVRFSIFEIRRPLLKQKFTNNLIFTKPHWVSIATAILNIQLNTPSTFIYSIPSHCLWVINSVDPWVLKSNYYIVASGQWLLELQIRNTSLE